jgi:thymidylate synthase (FAD)
METPQKVSRHSVEALDDILGVPFKVLDQGFVRVCDYMGADESIVQAARVSYGKGTKKISEDRGLIRYLMRHRHSTPMEMCEIKLHIRMPMDSWRQMIRHRTANVNETSTRYSEAIDATQVTAPDKWRLQSAMNKQGSAGYLDEEQGRLLTEEEADLQKRSRTVYEERLKKGVAREQARKDLPLSTYTEAYWKIDLHNLLHFLGLRMDAHAQEEIRAYANIIGEEIVARWCPIAWQAFKDYRLGAVSLSRMEADVLKAIANQKATGAIFMAQGYGWLERDNHGGFKRNREREECEGKLAAFGVPIPWEVENGLA